MVIRAIMGVMMPGMINGRPLGGTIASPGRSRTGQLVLQNETLFNATFATVQLALGLGLIWRRTARAALAGTIGWGLAVWFLGETLGSLFSGSATPITGAPGAALLYAVIAVLLWPRKAGSAGSAGISRAGASSAGTFRAGSSLAASSMLGRTWSRLVWLGLWGSFSYLVQQAQVRAPGALRIAIGGLARGEPRWLASMDSSVANALDSGGLVLAVVFAVLFAVIAVGVLVPAMIRPVLILAALTAIAIWVLGENFGGILTGTATDPNTGPLLILLIAAFWPTGLRDATAHEPRTARRLGPATRLRRHRRVLPPTGARPMTATELNLTAGTVVD